MHIPKLTGGDEDLLAFIFQVLYNAFKKPHMGSVYNINPDLQFSSPASIRGYLISILKIYALKMLFAKIIRIFNLKA